MKHKVSELDGALLDAAVAKVLGLHEVDGFWCRCDVPAMAPLPLVSVLHWRPSADWDQGGPIIERERIGTGFCESGPFAGKWFGQYDDERLGGNCHQIGDSPLIAAMRAYVASRFGEEVELP